MEILPLLKAVSSGNLCEVEELLIGGVNVNAEGHVKECGDVRITPLSLAAERGNVELVRALILSPNIDVNRSDCNGNNALHRASSNGHLEVVEALLTNKIVDVNNTGKKKFGNTPLHLASMAGHKEVVEALLKVPGILTNKKDKFGNTALHRCSCYGQIEVVKMLLNMPGILVNEKEGTKKHTPLHLAANFCHEDTVEVLLSHPDIDVNVKDSEGETPLHTSVSHSNLKIIEMLLKAGIDVNKKSQSGLTAAKKAEKMGHTKVVELIVSHMKNAGTYDVIQKAKKKQDENLRVKQVKISKQQIDDIEKGNELRRISCARVEESIVSHLKHAQKARKKQDVDQNLHVKCLATSKEPKGHNSKGKTSGTSNLNMQLLLAVEMNDLDNVKEFLKLPGIDVNSVDLHKNTPLHIASEKGHAELVNILLEVKGIDVNAKNKDESKLMYPKHYGDDPDRAKLDIGKTPLHLAVIGGHFNVVKLLLDYPGIDVNAKDKYYRFPLLFAVKLGNTDIVRELLNHSNIDVNARDICNDHFTLLHVAVESNYLEIVKMLISHPNIDVNLIDKYYVCTPLHLAVQKGYHEMVEVISKCPKLDARYKDIMKSLNAKKTML